MKSGLEDRNNLASIDWYEESEDSWRLNEVRPRRPEQSPGKRQLSRGLDPSQ